jgi:hypothetical protein
MLLGWMFGGQKQTRPRFNQSFDRGPDRGRIDWNSDGDRGSAGSIEKDETAELIASNKVQGTTVYDRDGQKLGEVYNFMVGKRSGKVAYAVLNFGGILGVGGSYYPLPWNTLTYDTERGGYVVDLDRDRIDDAPSHRSYEEPFTDPAYGQRVSEYWRAAGATTNM